jgi:hypothetical protein
MAKSKVTKSKKKSPAKKPSGTAYIRPDAAVVLDPFGNDTDVVNRTDVLNRSRHVERPSITGDGYPY